MLKLLKYLKKSTTAIIAVALLLFLQAYCDLSLPAYTSDIVNTGILKNGIDTVVPEVIRKSELDKLLLFIKEEEKEAVLKHYTILEEASFNSKEWSGYLKKYPLLESEPLYLWDREAEDTLSEYLSVPLMLVYSLGMDNDSTRQFKEQLYANLPAEFNSEDMDLFQIFTMLPGETLNEVISPLKEQIQRMPETIINSTASAYLNSEYQIIGVNVERMQTNYILIVGLKMLGISLAITAASILVTFLGSRIAAKMGKELRSRVFGKVLSFSNKEIDQFSTASLITRSTNDIQQIQMLIVFLIRVVIYSPILAIGGIIQVLRTNSSMTWVLGAGVATIFAVILVLFVVAMPKFKLMQKLVDRINLVTREILTGLPVIRAFSNEEHEKNRFDRANRDLTANSLFVNRAMTFMMPTLMLIMNLISILIVWVGADRINSGTMQVGDMIAFIQYTMQIIMSFLMITMISVMLPRASVSAHRIDEVLSAESMIHDPENEEAFSQKGVLEFRNVHFRYPNAEEDVLSDISFLAKPGKTTAIIGSTGSGKSTLVNLIPRLYDVTGGSILIDGVDIRKLKQKTLRSKLGFVPQKGVLFSGTIESNITFGDPTASRDEMIHAARIAQAEEFISNNPEGYQTPISEGGTNVSGGQKQRLAIARAVASKPEIYIFDDSFSALDYKTDATLRKALRDELGGSTLIIVAQRISTIMNADQILVLDEGRIVGKGTHKELLKECEVYQQIASSQLSKEELAHE